MDKNLKYNNKIERKCEFEIKQNPQMISIKRNFKKCSQKIIVENNKKLNFSFKKIPKLPLKKILKKSMSSIGTIYKYKNPSFQIQQYSPEIKPLTDSYMNDKYNNGQLTRNNNIQKIGSYRTNLEELEKTIRENRREKMDNNNKLFKLNYKFNELNKEFKENWKKLKNDLNSEINNIEMEFNIELNKQKIQMTHIKYEIKKLKQLMWDNQSLLTQLKIRIKDLQYKINGR